MTHTYDPRVKLFLVLCISTLGIVVENIAVLYIVMLWATLVACFFKVNFISLAFKLRRFMCLLVGIIIIQSLFIKSGNVLIGTENFSIITDLGLAKGLGYLGRIIIVLLSGAIVATTDARQMIQGLVQLRLPYEFAFMAAIGIKFLPLLMEQLNDTFTAIQLRGIDMRELKLKEKLEIYSYLFTPVIISTLHRAKKLSLSIEARGFRAYSKRSSIIKLKLAKPDYLLALASSIITISIVGLYYKITLVN